MRRKLARILLAGVLVGGPVAVLVLRSKTVGFDAGVRELTDGALDRKARLRVLRTLADAGYERAVHGDLRATTIAAMAAVALDDDPAYERVTALHSGLAPLLPGSPVLPPDVRGQWLEEASLGEPYLRSLLEGHQLEAAGDRVGARRCFEQSEAAATLWRRQKGSQLLPDCQLALRLARAGLERCR